MVTNVNADYSQVNSDSQEQLSIQSMQEQGLLTSNDLPAEGPNGTQYTAQEVQYMISYLKEQEKSVTGDTLKQLQAAQQTWIEVGKNGNFSPSDKALHNTPMGNHNLPVVGVTYTANQRLAALEYIAAQEQASTGNTLQELQAEFAAWQNMPTHG